MGFFSTWGIYRGISVQRSRVRAGDVMASTLLKDPRSQGARRAGNRGPDCSMWREADHVLQSPQGHRETVKMNPQLANSDLLQRAPLCHFN